MSAYSQGGEQHRSSDSHFASIKLHLMPSKASMGAVHMNTTFKLKWNRNQVNHSLDKYQYDFETRD